MRHLQEPDVVDPELLAEEVRLDCVLFWYLRGLDGKLEVVYERCVESLLHENECLYVRFDSLFEGHLTLEYLGLLQSVKSIHKKKKNNGRTLRGPAKNFLQRGLLRRDGTHPTVTFAVHLHGTEHPFDGSHVHCRMALHRVTGFHHALPFVGRLKIG